MELLTGENLQKKVDYSFGDHHVAWDKTLTGDFEPANLSNLKFMVKCKEFETRVMTLFIDNIRLYARKLEVEARDAWFIDYLMQNNDLLRLCAFFPQNQFVIFTGEEDTPIDETIKVPENVLGIYACNALFNNEKIHPFPMGLQRKRGDKDNRLGIMEQRLIIQETLKPNGLYVPLSYIKPTKLLYINCGLERHAERSPLAKFEPYEWCTTRFDKDSQFFPYDRYNEFLDELQDHKFVACPKGHGFDTHRIWETLYMRRVPVMLDHPYFRLLLKDFPVLFVKDWTEITERLLTDNDYLYQSATTMDLEQLSLDKWYSTALHSLTN